MTDPFASIRGQRVLVTGGLGFIGANLCRFLANTLGCDITAVDDLSNTTREAVRGVANLNLVTGDVRNVELMAPLMRTHDWVFHLACRTILTAAADPESDLAVNALSTLRLLEMWRQQAPASPGRFVYASSTSIYGNCRHLPADEFDPPHILNHYAGTKLLGEQYALLYQVAYGLPTVALRYSNVYGPGQSMRNPYCGVVGKFIEAAHAGTALTIYGDGEHTRDYTYVDDVVEATVLAAVAPQAIGEVFNVGTGVETSVNTLAGTLSEIAGQPLTLKHVDHRDIDNIRRRALSAEKIRIRLGWVPKTTVKEGLALTLAARRREDQCP